MPIVEVPGFLDIHEHKVIAHACNCQGRWGAGFAQQLREAYPKAAEWQLDRGQRKELRPGTCECWALPSKDIAIYCLHNSVLPGREGTSIRDCLKYTRLAVLQMLHSMSIMGRHEVHSPAINAGLFKVPWEQTRQVLEECLEGFPAITWIIHKGE